MQSKIIKHNLSAILSIVSNLLTLVSGLVMGFILPRFVSVETYAAYRTYILYAGYLGLFHFGFINGIYLKYGKYDYKDLPVKRFSLYTRVLSVSQLLVTVIPVIVLSLCRKEFFLTPVFFVVLNIFFVNVNCYFALINQFTRRISLDAVIQLIQTALQTIGFALLLVFKSDDYVKYLLVLTLVNFSVLLIHCFKSKEIIFNVSEAFDGSFLGEARDLISHGILILLSEYMGLIIIGIDSIVVNLFMSAKDFSVYSFTVSVVTVFFALVGIISKLIFPYLKRAQNDEYPNLYRKMKLYIAIFAAAVCGMAIVVNMLIPLLLPKYTDCIPLLKMLGVTAVLKGLQELLCGNFFKALNYDKGYFKTNILAFGFGLASDIAAYLLFKSMMTIAIASVISFLVWYTACDLILKKKMKMRAFELRDLLIPGIIMLYYVSVSCPPVLGFVSYYIVLVIAVIIIYRSTNMSQIFRT